MNLFWKSPTSCSILMIRAAAGPLFLGALYVVFCNVLLSQIHVKFSPEVLF
jgi:hypothetical protein